MAARLERMATPEELLATADEANVPLHINAHIHLPPNFSAFETVAQATTLAEEQGINVLGVNNYYDYSVYTPFAQLAERSGIFPLFGTEIITLVEELVQSGVKINDPGNPGKLYICGKGITRFAPLSPEAKSLLDAIRDRDAARMALVTLRLAEVFAEAGLDTELTEQAVKGRVVARHGSPIATVYLQERHVAQAFQEVIFERVPLEGRISLFTDAYSTLPKADLGDANAVQNEIRSALMKAGKLAYVPETFVDKEHAFRLILALGGIPCYPTLADGAKPICAFEETPEVLVKHLQEMDFVCAEFIPVRNTPAVLLQYVRAMREAGIIVTAGTEHNTRDLIPLKPTCLGGEAIPEEVAAIFTEGACVVAAHQYLVARGETGYVDADGRWNPIFTDSEERIAYFARLGKAVISSTV